jgi:putative tryptophan/tyrosine transport system substrate-binding protein
MTIGNRPFDLTQDRLPATGNIKKLRLVVYALSALLFSLCVSAEAQQAAKPPRIGFIMADASGSDPRVEAFRQGLRELSYVEGKNIGVEYRFAEGKEDRLLNLVAELVSLKVEIIVTDGTAVTRAVKNATKTIPIVMASDGDPVGNLFVASLARPGGNITGLTNLLAGLSGKRLEVLKDAVPGTSRFGIIWNPENPSSITGFKETQVTAQSLGVQLQSLEVRGPNDFESAFQAAKKGQAGALTVVSDSVMFAHRTRMLELAAKQRLPTMHTQSLWVQDGGMISYGTYFPDLYRRTTTYVDKILKGAKPADLPVEQPTKFELVINLKTAKQIGLAIPPNVLARADRVIR